LDSSRPSMESIGMSRPGEESSSPAPAKNQRRQSSESQGSMRKESFGGDDISGRRPILESVRERKSEYGFEGYDPDHVLSDARATESARNNQLLDAQKTRRYSTSPKLPDLNRMSGFGMDDFFSKPETPELPKTEAVEPTPTSTNLSSPIVDSTLRSQPSLGFRSVVNQAFDRVDKPNESSLPPTPASRTGSMVRRTDNDGTGTAGISPIMSRVPSSVAAAESRQQDGSTPRIPEVPEPSSPPATDVAKPEPEAEQPPLTFKPGHRRDLSTPSPANSPARTPDLGEPRSFIQGQQAVITGVGAEDESPLQPPRPIIERDASFRPSLPGGWTSYATSAANSTGQPEQLQTPRAVTPSGSGTDEDEHDITPTAAKIPGIRMPTGDAAALPPSDLPVVPLSGVNSTTLDPNLPALERVSPEIQLRQAVPETLSSASPPPLPMKDTPVMSQDHAEQFPPTPPLKPKHQMPAKETPGPSVQPRVLATLSTGAGLDDENDKLQNEIVKSLSPRPSAVGEVSEEHEDYAARESSYLADYYFQSNDDEEEPLPSLGKVATQESNRILSPVTSNFDANREIRPLSPRRPQEEARPSLPHKFSWDQSLENVSVKPIEEAAPESESTRPLSEHAGPGSSAPEAKEWYDESLAGSSTHLPAGDEHASKDATILPGSAASADELVEAKSRRITLPEPRPLSLAEEKELASPLPLDDVHPAVSSSSRQDAPGSPLYETLSHSASHQLRSAGPDSRIMSFKEIANVKDRTERIQKFAETRERFATMDTGLNDWLSALQALHPEHAEITGAWGAGSRLSAHGLASVRSRFSKATGQSSLQAPYYTHYLNATSPSTPVTPTTQAGPSASGGTQQGFSPAGAKLTSQQVQAKGKEFLHSAGVFGGKAGKAGKGLLAKGKNKLRSAGSGDKVD